MVNISLVGIGYWGSNILRELKTIKDVSDIEEIDIKNGITEPLEPITLPYLTTEKLVLWLPV